MNDVCEPEQYPQPINAKAEGQHSKLIHPPCTLQSIVVRGAAFVNLEQNRYWVRRRPSTTPSADGSNYTWVSRAIHKTDSFSDIAATSDFYRSLFSTICGKVGTDKR
jgi:hypothetical protein